MDFFALNPQLESLRFKQLYLPDTNILLTRYLSQDAVVELIDFMPVDQDGGSQFAYAHQIIRKVKAVKGPVRLKLRCAPRFDYARRTHDVCKRRNAVCFRPEGAQLQLDIYGEIMDAVYLSNKYSSGISKDGWQRVIRVMEWLRDNWDRDDEGIWEFRAGRKHFLHSRLMCWVAFDRVIRLSQKRSLDAPIAEWLLG